MKKQFLRHALLFVLHIHFGNLIHKFILNKKAH